MELLETLHRSADLIRASKRLLLLTSAGMSADSNIPTFRDKEGYWKNFQPFKEKNLETPDQVVTQWEEIKTKEKSKIGRKSVLDGIPSYLPSLQRSQKLQKKAANHGFDWDKISSVFDKLDEEIAEFKEAVLSRKEEDMSEELGDILFVLVNIAKFNKIDAEEALRNTNNKFITRFQHIEVEVTKRGKTLKETPLEELEQYWQDAKGDKSSS